MKPLDPTLHHASRARRWVRRELSFSDLHGILLWAGLIGFSGALVTAAFHEAIRLVTYLFTGRNGGFVALAMALSPWQRALIPTLGSLLAGLILQYGTRLVPRRRSTDYMEAVTVGDGFLSVRASLVKSASSLCTIGSGGSIGREGAMVQLSATCGSILGRLLSLHPTSRRLLVACGAAAGIASVYNSPLAAALFVSEILLGSIELESIGPLIVSAVIANATVHQLLGYAPVYEIPPVRLQGSTELLFYLGLGLAAGHLAPAFLWLLDRARELFARLQVPVFARLTLGGLVVGGLSVLEPRVWGNGFSVVNSILHDPWTWWALLSVLICKLLATSAMVGSGAVGGVFTPTLFCGAVLGALAGTLVGHFFPGDVGSITAYAVVGMGAFLAATTHAPLTSILMVFELTRQYEIVLPLMIAAIAADYTSKRYGRGKSIYAESLGSRSPRRTAPENFELIALVHRDEDTVPPQAGSEVLKQLFAGTTYNNLQVVDENGRWLGVVGRKAAASASAETTVETLMTPESRTLHAGMSLEDALQVASGVPSETLPLVADASMIYLGTVAKSDLLRALHEQLRRLRS